MVTASAWPHVCFRLDDILHLQTVESIFLSTFPAAGYPRVLLKMSIVIEKILAASPNTERGRPTQLSTDPKGERIAYAVSIWAGQSSETQLNV